MYGKGLKYGVGLLRPTPLEYRADGGSWLVADANCS